MLQETTLAATAKPSPTTRLRVALLLIGLTTGLTITLSLSLLLIRITTDDALHRGDLTPFIFQVLLVNIFAGGVFATMGWWVSTRIITPVIHQAEDADRQRLTAQSELEVAQQVNEAKDQFISILSHELRTPLAVIVSSASMLEHYSDRLSDERRTEHYQRIQGQARYMTDMLDDLMLISQARQGKLAFKPQPIDLPSFCQSVLDEIRPATATATPNSSAPQYQFQFDAAHDFEAATADAVFADPNMLRHILHNLLSNAIKYSPDGGLINLTLRREQDDELGMAAVIAVSDQGVGIPQADHDQLFESFYRAGNVKNIRGHGLGLSIVRESVTRHGGRVSFNSTVGVGTTFTVVLPVRPSQA